MDGSVYALEKIVALLVLIPWVLTTIALLTIMYLQNRTANSMDDFFDVEDEDLIPDWVNEKEVIRVAVVKDRAYWVHDNVFYESDVTPEPDFSTARPVDTMSMRPKQLNELLVILDELEEYGRE